MFHIYSRQGAEEILEELCETFEQLSEKQELLATLMESKKSPQKDAPEEFQRQKSKEALELLGRKHNLGKLERERDRARMLQRRDEGGFAVATDSSSMEKLAVEGSFFPLPQADPRIWTGRLTNGPLRRCLQKKKVKKLRRN